MYKRGQFEQARKYLERAVAPSQPDPVVLDHLGDVMYRLEKPEEAQALWQQSLQRLAEMNTRRADLVGLKDQVEEKLRQVQAGEQVEVAPVAGDEG